MLGHRRPSSLALALLRIALLMCAVTVDAARGQLLSPVSAPQSPLAIEPAMSPATESYRLRISWGGGDGKTWLGRVRLNRGKITQLKPLGLDADAVGSQWIENGELRIGDLSAHQSDAVEVLAEAGSDAQLQFDLADTPKTKPAQAQIALSELARRPFQVRLDESGNTLEVVLIPNPQLEISVKRDASRQDSLIYSPGEQLSFEVSLQLPAALHGTTVDVQTTLAPARRKDALWTDTQKLNVPIEGNPKIDLNVPLQQPDGVYTVRVAVSQRGGYSKFFKGTSSALAERSFEIAVIDPRPAAATAEGKWTSVLEIDPTNPRWIERLPAWTQFRRIPGLNLSHGPLGSIARPDAWDLPLGRFIELPATPTGGDAHWQAYTLPIEAVAINVPHLLEIEYPGDEPQHFGVSILEPNAAGTVDGIHRDAGVYIEGLGRSERKQKLTHRVLFWPRTQAPLLVVRNNHPTAVAHFGQIRVLKRVGPLASPQPLANAQSRLVAAYLAKPLVAESLNASQTNDVPTANKSLQSVADYQTFYESATRLAEYVRYGGYNAAVVSALADGSSIYPSGQSQFTPRYNSSRSTDGLQEADGLGLVLRVFDRERLTLIPAIEFTAPIERLEALRRTSDPQVSGLEWVGPNGQTWLAANPSRRGLAPYYNILDPRVQQVVSDVVREIVARYGSHNAFGGLAIQLTSDGYAQLPSMEWGLDDATIKRFELATGISLAASGPDRFAARYDVIRNQYAREWVTWRTQEVSQFYSRLAEIVRGNTDRHLVLTTERLFDHPQVSWLVRPSLLEKRRADLSMYELGIDREFVAKQQAIVLCDTSYVEPTMPLADCANDLELNTAFARSGNPQGGGRLASLLYHRSEPVPFAAVSAGINVAQRISDATQVLRQSTASGSLARKPYLQALADNDSQLVIDGGDLLPIGQDEALRGLRSSIASLPVSAQVVETSKQPVFVRVYSEANQTTILVMNMSPWTATAQVMLDLPRNGTLDPLGTTGEKSPAQKPIAFNAGRQSWQMTLEPYELRAMRAAIPGAKVSGVQADLSSAGVSELAAYVNEFTNRDLSAQHEYRALANPSFESLNGKLAGWTLDGDPATSGIQLDPNAPQDGKSSLYFRATKGDVRVLSEPFTSPATGQLMMIVSVRSTDASGAGQMRLVVESFDQPDGERYRQSSKWVPLSSLVQPNQGWAKRPLAVPLNDLPLDSKAKIRVGFEFTGGGEAWLDNVKLYSLLFPFDFYANAQPEILRLVRFADAAQQAHRGGQYTECLDLLDGYWPRFVMNYTPPATPKIASLPPAPARANNADNGAQPPATQPKPSTPPADQGQQSSPSVGDRFKSLVPHFR